MRFDLIDFFYGLECFSMNTNRTCAKLLLEGKLSLRKKISVTCFKNLFNAPGALSSCTVRGNFHNMDARTFACHIENRDHDSDLLH